MRDVAGRRMAVNGRTLYVEEVGGGDVSVVFEAGAGCGRTCWDRVVPLLEDRARLVAYDRAGRALTSLPAGMVGIEELADDLVAMIDDVVPGDVVLVAHSMGGLVARRAAESLGARMRGLLLIDPLPETSPVYDTWDDTTEKVDRMLAVTQALTRIRPLARVFSANLRRLYPADTYEAMLTEDFTPSGTAQTRREMQALAAAIPEFRARPPRLPDRPTVLISAARPEKGRERQNQLAQEHQRRYAESLPDGLFESVDSAHFIQAELPDLVAARIQQLL